MQGAWWLGIREDLDLDRCWWHRLAKFLYFSLAALVGIAIIWWLFVQGEPTYEPKGEYVRVTSNLHDTLVQADLSVPNVIPGFLALPGQLGIQKDGKLEDSAWRQSYLTRSICTPDAIRHSPAVAEALNKRDYTTKHTGYSVVTSLADGDGKLPEHARFCWFDPAFTEVEIRNVVKYEFTTVGLMKARVDYWWPVVLWIGVAHLLLSNFYYRGVVYVICGPRGKVKEKYLRQQAAPAAAVDFDEGV
jgi:hypothetical protein